MVEYTIAVCNYNMAETLEESVRSIDDLIDDRFEILVLDDGSTDGSLKILDRLEAELPRVRVVHDDNNNLAEARRASVEAARGEYVLIQLDADDIYYRGITDFVEIYHQIDDQVLFDPFLKGYHIQMARRDLLLTVSHRSMGYHEDRDLWRRMIAEGHLIGLHHKPIRESVGYDRGFREKVEARFDAIVSQFRSGVSLESYMRWLFWKLPTWRPGKSLSFRAIVFNIVCAPLAYLIATRRGVYGGFTAEYADMTRYTVLLPARIMTLSQIEAEYGISIDRDALSTDGCEVYDLEPGEHPGPRYWLNERANVAANRRKKQGR
ncbi:glycosyltransferase family 2 protein [Haloplanus salinus]|jgi:glycosyltransferase involved in cell wall biosynthesis|uniref:Glycosyltransferase family 2 protein n=1 Tax=Haloplanus salinus TaxID=1126245 RepID=A0A368NEH7_9EURY|nr:glycosyltransferase family A protein [Haloplanus salinus]RCU47994.1 glycosyltransferase family 2 protein [Haloplanus salinus]